MRLWYAVGLVMMVAVALVYGARALHSDRIALLQSEGFARWIHVPAVPDTYQGGDVYALFRTKFQVAAKPGGYVLDVRAMKRVQVTIDGVPIFASGADLSHWKVTHEVTLPALAPGEHELELGVMNKNGPACVLAYCAALGIATGYGWEGTENGKTWVAALPAEVPIQSPLSVKFETPAQALVGKGALFVAIFILAASAALWGGRLSLLRRIAPTPAAFRWLLMAAWLVMAANNMVKLPLYLGFDIKGHLDYVAYVAEHWRIPLASDGWQMFQSPLFYMLAAPVHIALSGVLSPDNVQRALRIFPLLAGLAQIEIAYRLARHVWPERNDLQNIAVLFAALLPMNIYISQYVSNEPVAGALTGLTLLLAARLMTRDPQSVRARDWFVIGAALGLAILAKVTAVILIPPLMVLIAWTCLRPAGFTADAIKRGGIAMAVMMFTIALICGWYYARNYIEMGRFFIGGWDPARGIVWWQDPGFRTPGSLVYFGQALIRPVYAGVGGIWDGLYATFWMDSYLSGIIGYDYRPPWNYSFLLAMTWLGLLPTFAMLIGFVRAFIAGKSPARPLLFFTACCAAIYLAALIDHFLTNPFFCATKSFYAVGLTAGFALLTAAGLDLLTRQRVVRAAVYGLFACWAVAAYAGYFVL